MKILLQRLPLLFNFIVIGPLLWVHQKLIAGVVANVQEVPTVGVSVFVRTAPIPMRLVQCLFVQKLM